MSFGETFNIGGIVASVSNPTVTNVTSASGNEGTSLVHTVTLSAATTTSTNYTYSLSGGTATAGVDYTVPPTFSNGVTLSGSLTVPTAVSSFTVTVAAISDGSSESSETYNLTIGGITGVGTISDVSGDLVANIAAARSSGAAPLYVNFDATVTTSAIYGSDAWKNVLYTWSFGDTAGGATWTNGLQALSKNADQGPNVGHLFETPGTYTVYLTAFDGVNTSTISTSITVDDPDVVWAGTKTVCFSIDGDFTGAPFGCTQVTVAGGDMSTNFATHQSGGDKRLLYKRGQAWTCSSELSLNTTKGMIGAFGSGGGSVTVTATNGGSLDVFGLSNGAVATDWRIMDIDVVGNLNSRLGGAYQDTTQITFLRVSQTNAFSGLGFDSGGGSSSARSYHDQIAVVECSITDPDRALGSSCMYAGLRRSSVLGNYFDNNSLMEQVVRFPLFIKSNCSHNHLMRPYQTKETIKLHSMNFAYTGEYTEDCNITNNSLDNRGGIHNIDVQISIGTGNPGTGERCRRVIVESNGFYSNTGYSGGASGVRISSQDIVVRNNIIDWPCSTDSSSGFYFMICVDSAEPINFPTQNLDLYNNSFYCGTMNNAAVCALIYVLPASEITVCNVKNNLMYVPNMSSNRDIVAFGDSRPTLANNTSSIQTNPNFTTTPPVTVADWKPTTGYAVNGGGSLPIWNDVLRVARTGTYDIGAAQP